MSQVHPTDEQLLLHAEGERSDLVAAHLASCPDCRRLVAEAEAGRELLRSAPLLEFPAERREAVLAALPRRGRGFTPRRFLAVAVPMTAVAAAVAVVAITRPAGDVEVAAEEMAAEARHDATAMEAAPADAAPVLTVAGPPEAVARILRDAGLDADVAGDGVEVRGAEPDEIARALDERPAGPVPVYSR